MSSFKIEDYLNSLPDDIEVINVSYKYLDYLPDLSRFKNLKELWCCNNELVTLPTLPNSLKRLDCDVNELICLPTLPESLQILRCEDNKLVSLPLLPNSLQNLWCDNNKLTFIAVPNSLLYLSWKNNPIYNLINDPIFIEAFEFINVFKLFHVGLKNRDRKKMEKYFKYKCELPPKIDKLKCELQDALLGECYSSEDISRELKKRENELNYINKEYIKFVENMDIDMVYKICLLNVH